MIESLSVIRSVWTVLLTTSVAACVFALSLPDSIRFAEAERELRVLKQVDFNAFEPYVRDQVNKLYWHPAKEHPESQTNLLLPKRPPALRGAAEITYQRRLESDEYRTTFENGVLEVLESSGIAAKGLDLSASTVFPWATSFPPTDGTMSSLLSYIDNQGSDLLVFKPDLDSLLVELKRGIMKTPKGIRGQSLATTLACRPLSMSALQDMQLHRLWYSSGYHAPQIPVFVVEEAANNPLQIHTCSLILVTQWPSVTRREIKFDVVGRAARLDWHGFSSWFSDYLELNHFDDALVRKRYWNNVHGKILGTLERAMLPKMRKVLPDVGDLTLPQAILQLASLRETHEAKLEIAGVSFPANVALLCGAILPVILLLEIKLALKQVLQDTSRAETRPGTFPWVAFLPGASNLALSAVGLMGLPMCAIVLIWRAALLRAAGVADLSSVAQSFAIAWREWGTIEGKPSYTVEAEALWSFISQVFGIFALFAILLTVTFTLGTSSLQLFKQLRKAVDARPIETKQSG